MILDKDLILSNEQSLVGVSGATSTTLDFLEGGDAVGQELAFHVVVPTTFTGPTSLTITVQTSADNSTWSDVVLSRAIPVAELTKGNEVFTIRVPKGLDRYVRLDYAITGTTASTGKLTAFMSKDI